MRVNLEDLMLTNVTQETDETGLCAMEAAALLSGQEADAFPGNICKVIAYYVNGLQHYMTQAECQDFKPYLKRMASAGPEKSSERAVILVTWLATRLMPHFVYKEEHAEAMRTASDLTKAGEANSTASKYLLSRLDAQYGGCNYATAAQNSAAAAAAAGVAYAAGAIGYAAHDHAPLEFDKKEYTDESIDYAGKALDIAIKGIGVAMAAASASPANERDQKFRQVILREALAGLDAALI